MQDITDSDALVGRVAALQHGNFTRSQAHSSGLSNRQLAHRVRAGRLRQSHPSVFTTGGAPSTFRQEQMAACLAIDGAVAGLEAAAILGGFEPSPSERIAVLVPHGRTNRLTGVHVHRTCHLPSRHITVVDSIPTTTTVRTIIDLAGVYRRNRMVETLDWALTARRLDMPLLIDEFNEMARSGRRGAALLRPLILERADGLSVPASVLERRMMELIAGSDLPMPVLQWSPPWGGSLIGRVDFAYPEERLVIEVDGRRWHTRVKDFSIDPRRDQLAIMSGWIVERFPWKQVDQRPDEVIDTIRESLGRRRRDLSVQPTR
jgi:hypothetical protein